MRHIINTQGTEARIVKGVAANTILPGSTLLAPFAKPVAKLAIRQFAANPAFWTIVALIAGMFCLHVIAGVITIVILALVLIPAGRPRKEVKGITRVQ